MENSVMDNTAGISQTPVESVQIETERMLPQSKVNELVGNARREGADAAASRAVEEYKRSQQQQASQNSSQSFTQQPISDDYLERKTVEILEKQKSAWEKEQQERLQTEAADRIVKSYNEKIAAGKDKYQDFEAVTSNVNMAYYPNVVQLLAEYVDNAPDILYNLAQRRGKLDEIDRLCERNPQDAIYEIKRLSDSIKSNDVANQIKTSRAPLSQTKSSNTGMDSGALSMSDLKRKYKG